MVDVVAHDTHPPLYFFLQWLQVHAFGTPLVFDRAPAALFGAVLVPLTVLFARGVAGSEGALLAGLLVALSPMALFYSRDARPHIAAATLVLVAAWLLVRVYAHPSWTRLTAYSLAAGAAILTAYPSAVLLAGQAAGLWMWRRKISQRAWIAGAAIGVVVAPWLFFALPNAGQARSILFSERAGGVPERLAEFARVTGYAMTGGFSLADVVSWPLTLAVIAPVFLGALAWVRRPSRSPALFILVGMTIATLGLYGLTSSLGGQFVARYLLPLVAPLAVLYAAAVSRLTGALRVAAAALLVTGWCWTSFDVLTRDKAHRDASTVAAFLITRVEPGDRIVFDWFSTRGQVVAVAPALTSQTAEGGYDIPNDLGRAAQSGGRLWLVTDNAIGDRQRLFDSVGVDVRADFEPRTVIGFKRQ